MGHFRGGLAHANVLASVIFAGMSGSAIADTGGLGAIELKAMKDGGYEEDFSLAVTGASSLIGPVIPPSVPLVLYGVTASVSIADLFDAGILPGILLGLVMIGINSIICKDKTIPVRKRASLVEIWRSFRLAFWSCLLVVIIRCGITMGWFTPTEAAVVAVAYALALSFAYKTMTIRMLPKALKEVLDICAGVLFLISTSTLFSWILTFTGIPQTVARALLSVSDSPLVIMLIISLILLVLGLFMDSTPAILIMTPILYPVITSMGIDPVLFGVILVLWLMVGLVTPPVGMVLFVLSSISGVSIGKISKAIVPYIVGCISIILLLIVYTCLMVSNPALPLLY